MNKSQQHIARLLLALAATLAATLALWSCANIGSPEGGPRDYQPPVVTKTSPTNGSVRFKGNSVRIDFDEVVQLKDQQTKVVVSPAPKQQPTIKNLGKSITVTFNDTLLPATTYTIDFSDAIEDNNEGNRLDGYTYSFSTGDSIDTLRVSGMVLRARDLEPMQHVLVGVHSNLSDTAVTRLPFDRIGRTNDKGEFTLHGLKPGSYHIFALNDMDGDYRWNRTEDFAFSDEVVVPSVTQVTSQDTTFTFDHRIDTIKTQQHLVYLPNDVLLSMFNENHKQLYLEKNERQGRNKLYVKLSATNGHLPELRVLQPERHADNWSVLERNATGDSLFYWLTDSTLIKADTMRVEMRYMHTDTTGAIVQTTDTLKFDFRFAKAEQKAKQQADKEKQERQKEIDKLLEQRAKLVAQGKDTTDVDLNLKALRAMDKDERKKLEMKATMGTTLEVTDTLGFTFTTPIASVDQQKVHLQQMNPADSTWAPVELPPLQMADSLSLMHYVLPLALTPEADYRMTVDSAAITDIYGLVNDSLAMKMKVKSLDEYGYVTLHVNSGDSAFVQLLNGNDKVVREQQVKNGTVNFTNLKPDTYYARIILDRNGNGKWDTGSYDTHQQPEEVYYYPYEQKLRVRKAWGREETWDIYATPLNQQKCDKIKQNKPENKSDSLEQKKATTDEEEDDEFNSGGFGSGAYSSDKYRTYQQQNSRSSR